jgi:hypothetical protein
MLIDIFNFIFVYLFSGFILSLFIKLLTKKAFDNKLIFLLGYGISPLLISLLLYYLYSFFPGRDWIFYSLIIYAVFAIFFIVSIKEIKRIRIKNILEKIKGVLNKTFQLDIFKKILLAFVLFVVIFNLTTNIFYRVQWVDAFRYLKQGFVYSQDRSNERLNTREPFSSFGESNPLYGPEKEYRMNTAIRPALPIFYSFFYIDKKPNNFNFASIDFIYSYYFILLILIIAYILLKQRKKQSLIGIVILLSCYFITIFSILDYKEIIILFYSIFSLYLLYLLIKGNCFLLHPILIGIMCGLITYINYSGAIITGILFILGLIFFKSKISKKLFVITIATIFFVLSSGGEFSQYKKFILNKSLISLENQEKTFESKELESYKIREKEGEKTLKEGEKTLKEGEKIDKKDILIKGKLQGFIQIQFFGFIYLFFLFILILTLAKRKRIDLFSKLNLSFIGLFFFIVMDPFFLNPHKYAYVLSINPKYTVMLFPFMIIFITTNFMLFKRILKFFNTKYLLSLTLIPLLFLSPEVRNFLSIKLYKITENFIPFYNNQEYYMERIEKMFIWMIFLSFLVFIFYIINNVKKRKNDIIFKKFIFLLIFFIVPYFYILSNNYNIINTFRYIISENTLKNQKTVGNPRAKALHQATHYINNELPKNSKILIYLSKTSISPYLNASYYINNNQRLLLPGEFQDDCELSSCFEYALIFDPFLENTTIKNWRLLKKFNGFSLITTKNE